MTFRESLHLEQAAKLIDCLARVTAAGYSVLVAPGSVTVSGPGIETYKIVRSDVRDSMAHALQSLIWDLDSAAKERAKLLERLNDGTESILSHELDLRVGT